jgi:CopG family transcriptional regulator, nickel-responsive regulator
VIAYETLFRVTRSVNRIRGTTGDRGGRDRFVTRRLKEGWMSNQEGVTRIGVSVEPDLLSRYDRLCARRGYSNRSEALRDLMRMQLSEDELATAGGEAVGTVTVIYDHHQRELEARLTEYQHQHLHSIVSAMHVHLSERLCLEVLVLRGKATEVKHVADGLVAARGVKHGRLVMTSIGGHLRD